MADPAMSVTPYWELTFDADGDVDAGQRDRLLAGVRERGVVDLSSSRTAGTATAPVRPGCTAASSPRSRRSRRTARLGYVGVVWPSMRFSDEPIPDLKPVPAVARRAAPHWTRTPGTRCWRSSPGRATVVEQLARLLDQRPDEGASLEEFGRLVRLLVEVAAAGPQGAFTADTIVEGVPEGTPGMLCGDAADGVRGVRGGAGGGRGLGGDDRGRPLTRAAGLGRRP